METETRTTITLVRIPKKARRIEYSHEPGPGHAALFCYSINCKRERIETPEQIVLAYREIDGALELLLDTEGEAPEWLNVTTLEITASEKV